MNQRAVPDSSGTIAVIPTFNEAESLREVVERIRALLRAPDVLITDDASTDGTAQIADGIAENDIGVRVLHRQAKNGLGPAYVAGFTWAIEHGYAIVAQLDADGSHRPEELPQLLCSVERDTDLAIGSRWTGGGRIVNWPWYRVLLSRAGTAYARWALGVPVYDVTAGFRAWRATALAAIDLSTVSSQGYCFQVDMVRRACDLQLVVTEWPVTFAERAYGRSKMTAGIVLEAVLRVTGWGLQHRLWGRLQARLRSRLLYRH